MYFLCACIVKPVAYMISKFSHIILLISALSCVTQR